LKPEIYLNPVEFTEPSTAPWL